MSWTYISRFVHKCKDYGYKIIDDENKYRKYEYLALSGESIEEMLRKNKASSDKLIKLVSLLFFILSIIVLISSPSDFFKILLIYVLSAVFILRNRNENIRKEYDKRKRDFSNTLPVICLQLILLLNSGMVTESSLIELNRINSEREGILYRIFREKGEKCLLQNTSLSSELYSLAINSGDRSFIRFAGLIEDSKNKGSELSSKLGQELSMLLNERLQRAKALAKESETKLCFPLFLLLSVIIVISVLPAFLKL